MVTINTADIATFWKWFTQNHASLSALSSPDEPSWDLALVQLKHVHPALCFELSDPISNGPSAGTREFVITAQGDANLFPLVDALIAAAPSLPSWTFVSLKPPTGFDFTTTYEGVPFDSKTMWFLPLNLTDRPTELGLKIGIPGLTKSMEAVAGNAIMIILETGLGERSAAADVHYVEYGELPDEPEKAGYIELPELPAYIAWRKRRRGSTQ